jgi:hypothetical protein
MEGRWQWTIINTGLGFTIGKLLWMWSGQFIFAILGCAGAILLSALFLMPIVEQDKEWWWR